MSDGVELVAEGLGAGAARYQADQAAGGEGAQQNVEAEQEGRDQVFSDRLELC